MGSPFLIFIREINRETGRRIGLKKGKACKSVRDPRGRGSAKREATDLLTNSVDSFGDETVTTSIFVYELAFGLVVYRSIEKARPKRRRSGLTTASLR